MPSFVDGNQQFKRPITLHIFRKAPKISSTYFKNIITVHRWFNQATLGWELAFKIKIPKLGIQHSNLLFSARKSTTTNTTDTHENTADKPKRALYGNLRCTLTHFMPLVSFYTPWKHQKTSGFFMLFRGIERASGMKWVNVYLLTLTWRSKFPWQLSPWTITIELKVRFSISHVFHTLNIKNKKYFTPYNFIIT